MTGHSCHRSGGRRVSAVLLAGGACVSVGTIVGDDVGVRLVMTAAAEWTGVSLGLGAASHAANNAKRMMPTNKTAFAAILGGEAAARSEGLLGALSNKRAFFIK